MVFLIQMTKYIQKWLEQIRNIVNQYCARVDAKDLVHLQPAASRRMLCCLQLE